MKKDHINQKEAREVEIKIVEEEILDLRGKSREEAIAAYRRLLVAIADNDTREHNYSLRFRIPFTVPSLGCWMTNPIFFIRLIALKLFGCIRA